MGIWTPPSTHFLFIVCPADESYEPPHGCAHTHTHAYTIAWRLQLELELRKQDRVYRFFFLLFPFIPPSLHNCPTCLLAAHPDLSGEKSRPSQTHTQMSTQWCCPDSDPHIVHTKSKDQTMNRTEDRELFSRYKHICQLFGAIAAFAYLEFALETD